MRALCPGARDTLSSFPEEFARLVIPGFAGKIWIEPKPEPRYTLNSLQGRIGRIIVETPEVRTREGFGVGTTLRELRARLGPMFVAPVADDGDYAVPRANLRTSIHFFLGGFDGAQVPGGWTSDSAVYSDSIPGTAVVMWVELALPVDE